MANMKKISQINLQSENYAIDVHNDLKAKLSTDTGDNLKVTTKGYVDAAISAEAATRAKADEAIETKLNAEIQRSTTKDAEHDWAISDEIADRIAADTALDTKKLDKAPDGKVALLNENQKINLHYLSDAIVGQVKFGGIVSLSNVDAADIVPSALLKDAAMQASEFTPVTGVGTVSITADSTVGSVILQNKNAGEDETAALNVKLDFEGFYFITSASGTFADIGFETGDWLIACGGNWQKVDNTDAVTSVNGQIGAVTIDTGIMTINNVGPDKGNFDLVAGDNITITEGTNKLTIAATVPEQVQADWNENDTSSPAYVKNRTHYSGASVEIVHMEEIALSGPPVSVGYTFRDGETYDVSYWYDTDTVFSNQFTVKPDTYGGENRYCLIGTFMREPDIGVNIYLYGDGNGEYTELVSHTVDGYTAYNNGMLNIYTVGVKQLDAKYIPVDNETIRIENGKLVGAASSNIDLSNVDQDINVVGGHSVNISGDLNIDGDIAFGNLAATSLKVTNIPEEDDDVVNLKYFRENAGQGGNVNLEDHHGNVKITGDVEIDGDLKFNGDFEIASLDAQSVKVNGKRVLVEGDVAEGSVAGITTGSAENSLEGFNAEAKAPYSVAIGSNDSSLIAELAGEYIAKKLKVDVTQTNGTGAFTFGSGNKADSAGSINIGTMNVSGTKGYYYKSMTKVSTEADGTITCKFNLANGPKSNSAEIQGTPGISSKWAVNDHVCIYTGKLEYFDCGIISAINGSIITIKGLPAELEESAVYDSSYDSLIEGLGIDGLTSRYLPYDFTISAFHKEVLAAVKLSELAKDSTNVAGKLAIEIALASGKEDTVKEIVRWLPRDGVVELGFGAVTFGAINNGSGNLSFVGGFNNWQAGDYGATFGFENIGGDSSITAGIGNIAPGCNNIVAGYENDAKQTSHAVIAGGENTVNANNSIVFGFKNSLTKSSSGSIIGGVENTVTEGWCTATFGNNNTNNGKFNLLAGETNKIDSSYSIAAGQSNEVLTNYGAAFGLDNTVSAGNAGAAAFGWGNVTTRDCQLVAGRFADAPSDARFVVGNGTNKDNRKNAFVVHNDGRVTAGKNPTEAMDLVTKDYFENNATKVDWENINSDVHIKKNLTIDGELAFSGDIRFNSFRTKNLIVGDYYKEAANLIFAVGSATSGRGNFLNIDSTGNIGGEGGTFNIVTSGEGKNSGTIRNSIALGISNTINNDYAVALGYKNTNKGCAGAAIGCELTTLPVNLGQDAGYGQVVVGRYNATDKVSQFIVGSGSSASNRKNALTVRALSGSETYSVAVKDTDAITLGYLKNNFTGGSAKFPETAEDGSALKDGAIMVYRSGKGWVAENPPTAIYTGEVE